MRIRTNSWLPSRLYEGAVVVGGTVAVVLSIHSLLLAPPQRDCLYLAILTLVSGFLPVRLPKVSANISVSETFVFAATLLFGTAAGTLLVFLDALLIWAKLSRTSLKWRRMLFSLAASPLSIWIAGTALFRVSGTPPLAQVPLAQNLNYPWLVAGLAVFTILYFLLNSWLVAGAIALEQRSGPLSIWKNNFLELSLNYFAGASIAALLVFNTRRISWSFLAVIAPLMYLVSQMYSRSMERVEKAEKHVQDMNRVFMSTIKALAMAIDAKDQITHGHIQRVQRYTMELASALGVRDDRQRSALEAAALLHDTGKLAVPEYILNKPGPLTSSEFERMKLHAAVGADILKSIEFPYPVEPIVRHHHECWDGSGYPDGLSGSTIPLGARILSVVDCYDALTSDRPYRPRMTRQEAEQVLRDRRGTFYDPWVVDEFLKILSSLEQMDAADLVAAHESLGPRLSASQLEVISATTAEEREFKELSRELPKASTLAQAAEVLFRHLRRVVPAATLAFFVPRSDRNELSVGACSGVGASTIESITVPIGERISGWAFAHKQIVFNSDATLELGPVARTFSTPLKYALVAPLLDGTEAVALIALYGTNPFDKDHRRMLETAAALFQSSFTIAVPTGQRQSPVPLLQSRINIH